MTAALSVDMSTFMSADGRNCFGGGFPHFQCQTQTPAAAAGRFVNNVQLGLVQPGFDKTDYYICPQQLKPRPLCVVRAMRFNSNVVSSSTDMDDEPSFYSDSPYHSSNSFGYSPSHSPDGATRSISLVANDWCCAQGDGSAAAAGVMGAGLMETDSSWGLAPSIHHPPPPLPTTCHHSSTGLLFTTSNETDAMYSWRRCLPRYWTSADVLNFLHTHDDIADIVDAIPGERFQDTTGADLYRMTEEDFVRLDSVHGKRLFDCVNRYFNKVDRSCNLQQDQQSTTTAQLPSGDLQLPKGETFRPPYPQQLPKPVEDFIDNDDVTFGCSIDSLASDFRSQPTTFDEYGRLRYDLDRPGQSTENNFHFRAQQQATPTAGLDVVSDNMSDRCTTYTDLLTPSMQHPGMCGPPPLPHHDSHSFSFLQDDALSDAGDLTSTYCLPTIPSPPPPRSPPLTSPLERTISEVPSNNGDSSLSATTSKTSTASVKKRRYVRHTSSAVDGGGVGKCSKRRQQDVGGRSSSATSGEGAAIGQSRRPTTSSRSGGHLWEFIRGLLKSSESTAGHQKIIQWEDKSDGVFRIVDSKAVAKLWGDQKDNRKTKMTYEKLSRALRWCRTEKFLQAVPKDGRYPKKLCFSFGERAIDWDKMDD